MIEMVYSGKEHEKQDEVRIPKNIHQIGSNQSNRKIYIEDYVMKTLKMKPVKEDRVKYGVFLGDVKRANGNMYIFIKGMVEVRDIIENSIIFNDDIWSEIYRDIKQYFDKLNIVGWYVSVPYRVSDDMKGIKKNHLDNFAGNDKVCFLTDRAENEEGFFAYGQNGFEKQHGYYIYYEKNEKMKKYVKSLKNSVTNNTTLNEDKGRVDNKTKMTSHSNDSKNQKSNNVVCDNEKEKITGVNKKLIDSEMTEHKGLVDIKIKEGGKKEEEKGRKSFREILNEEGMESRSQGRIAYGVSGLLIIALLLSTVVMLNNYGELKNIKSTLAGISRDNEAKAVNEILSAYTETTTGQGDASKQSGSDKNNATSTQANKSDEKKDNSLIENGSNASGNNGKKSSDSSTIKDTDTENGIANKSDESGDNSKNISNTSESGDEKQNASGLNENINNKQNSSDSDKKEPDNKSISSAYSGQYHTVTPGQTLYDISMKYYGTSKMVDEIKERNNIDDDYTIRDGQKILLP